MMDIDVIPEDGMVPEKERKVRGEWKRKFDRVKPGQSFPIPSESVARVRSAMKYWLERSDHARTCRIVIEQEDRNTHRVYLRKKR